MTSVTNLDFAVFDETKFPTQKNPQTGPSPYWDKTTEGPSYIKPENRQKPLVASGELEKKYGKNSTALTPLLGTEYDESVNLTDILSNDQLLKDLALQISKRGVVVFKRQKDLTVEQQKELVNKLGIVSGKPKTSGLHIHPTAPAGGVVSKDGLIDPEVSFISSRVYKEYPQERKETSAAWNWHSDITFEPVGSDYTSLRLVELPETGGDTLWANGYALYEKLSPSLRKYVDTLTGTYSQELFGKFSEKAKFQLYSDERGAPENVGDELKAIHPIVRTNPVTGWKSLYAVGHHFTKINDITPIESQILKQYFFDTLIQSHDIHVRHKWDQYDIAIWDNRSAFHAINPDVHLLGIYTRTGIRTVSIGERAYFDPSSITQSEGLKKEKEEKEKTETPEKEAKE